MSEIPSDKLISPKVEIKLAQPNDNDYYLHAFQNSTLLGISSPYGSSLYTNNTQYLYVQREFNALKARRMIEVNSCSIAKSLNAAYSALKTAQREALKRSISALH
ncbi:hypothetical protein L2755_09415 [Shewanella abyssi]|uniref:hypothetical protein n=1 Tax=Shewanella abyssi TaxID=311789 RepID=UPI00200DC01C|nr:hypothetical protein [Shewanella abyssi]MCL1049838.1 hypothetical protein [Shewanella abyssi]